MGACFSHQQASLRYRYKEKTPQGCQVQIVDSQANKAIEDYLRNPKVLRRILEYFSNAELLELSFVNKLWNSEARSALKRRDNLRAHVQACSEDELHRNLAAFGKNLKRMNIAPFSGLSINLNPGPRWACPTGALNFTQETILGRLALKHFSVRLFQYEYKDDCPILRLIKGVLHYFSQVLESLTIDVDGQQEAFMEKIVQYCDFTRLKTLKLDDKRRLHDESYVKFVRVLVSRAPDLQDLRINGCKLQWPLEPVPAIDYGNQAKAPFNEIPDSAIDTLRLEEMRLEYTGPEFNFERFNRIFPTLLQVCCYTTLRVLILDAVLAVPLMCYNISLRNVQRLQMHIDYSELEATEPRLLGILKNFDFNHIFPSLHKITLDRYCRYNDLSPSHMDTIIEGALRVLWEPVPWRAFNITKLDLKDTLSNDNVKFFAEMLPNVQQLDVAVAPEQDIPFGSIWENWTELEILRVYGKNTGNFHSVFCGIFPEDIVEPRGEAEEILERVQIVPIMPAAALSLKTPTAFILVHCQRQDDTLMFTKRMGLFSWPRRPTLAVTFKTTLDDVCETLKHIENYTAVFDDDECPDDSEGF